MKCLEQAGYRVWKTESEEYGTTKHWQARIDIRVDFDGSIPLCHLNDKLFINAKEYDWCINGHTTHSFTFDICHENSEGQWCEIAIYGLKPEDVDVKLESVEKKLLNMWKVFNK